MDNYEDGVVNGVPVSHEGKRTGVVAAGVPVVKSVKKTAVKASIIDYARVVLDFVLLLVLIIAVSVGVNGNRDDETAAMHLYEVPVYLKSQVPLGVLWGEAVEDGGVDDGAVLLKFQTSVAAECVTIADHPMCVCIAAAVTRAGANNCLLGLPVPAMYSDWNRSAVSYALFIWFSSAFAASVGTIPWTYSYESNNATIEMRSKIITWGYATLCGLTVLLPILCTVFSFTDSGPHWGGLFVMFMWGWIAVVWVGSYNCGTLYQYFMFATYTTHEKLEGVRKELAESKMQSIVHFIFYVNLLVSAPAIATVLHLTIGWAEYSTIINTTLLISTMFAVDAFAAEMVNYWTYHKTTSTGTHQMKSVVFAVPVDTLSHQLDLPLGMIRLTTFTVNSALCLLFKTLAYPVSAAHEESNSAVFIILILAFVGMLLLPDLLREFTHRIPFHSTQFRLFGDMTVRTLVLFFVWRASVSGRV